MASVNQAAIPSGGNEVWSVEQRGIDLVPDAERKGVPFDLFWIWAGSNIVITYIIVGSVLAGMGLTFGQMLAVTLAGNLLYAAVGYLGVPGARTGTSQLAISRGVFGRRGNIIPSLLSWATVVGWEAVNLVLGAFALYSLAEAVGFPAGSAGKAVLLILLAVVTFGAAVLGHATIVYLQRFFTWGLGALMIGLIPFVVSHADLGAQATKFPGGASFATLCLAFSVIAALPMSYVNYSSDYTRYLKRDADAVQITWWTFIGSFLPAAGITILGYLAATAADLTDPVGGFKPLLPSWYFVAFLLVVVGGAITNNFINTYSSGLSLQASGLKLSRANAVILDAILATAASIYAVFYYDFTSTFTAFLGLMVAWIAPWCGVCLIDAWLRRETYDGPDLLRGEGGRYWYSNGWHVPAFAAWLAGIAASLATTNAALYVSPLVNGVLGGADLSVLAGVLVAGGFYWLMAARPVPRSEA